MKSPYIPTVLVAPLSGNSISMERAIKQAHLLLTQMLLETENLSVNDEDMLCTTLDDLELILEGIARSQQHMPDDTLQLVSNMRYVCKNQITSGDNNE